MRGQNRKVEKYGYNWSEGFTAYCNGASLEEVAEMLKAPLEKVRTKAHQDEWNALRGRLALVTNTTASGIQLSEGAEHRLELINANRAKNLKLFETLREHLIEKLEALRDGTLKMEKHWNNKGAVVTAVTPPSTGDWVNIATYARTIADGTYRAIGDITSSDKGGGGNQPNANSLPAPPATVIILPASIAAPREERVLPPSGAQVIDLQDVKVEDAGK